MDHDKDSTPDGTGSLPPKTIDKDRYHDIIADNDGDALPGKHNLKKEITSDKDVDAGMPIMTPPLPQGGIHVVKRMETEYPTHI